MRIPIIYIYLDGFLVCEGVGFPFLRGYGLRVFGVDLEDLGVEEGRVLDEEGVSLEMSIGRGGIAL